MNDAGTEEEAEDLRPAAKGTCRGVFPAASLFGFFAPGVFGFFAPAESSAKPSPALFPS